MIKFFRTIRQSLLLEGKTAKYLAYAAGEIILVVIGILIALQVNNLNELKNTRTKEVVYLKNIKSDLQSSLKELNEFLKTRKAQIISANTVVAYYNGKPVDDWNSFNKDIVSIYTWQPFYLSDNTFQELISSGNLAMIANDSIKNGLLNLDVLYKKLKYNENHFRYDAEVALYEPSYNMLDIDAMAKNYFYQLSGGKTGELGNLKKEDFEKMFTDQKQKNGFVFAALEFSGMINHFENMKQICDRMIALIDKDLAK
jgi:hypothetical protein